MGAGQAGVPEEALGFGDRTLAQAGNGESRHVGDAPFSCLPPVHGLRLDMQLPAKVSLGQAPRLPPGFQFLSVHDVTPFLLVTL
jgi:hypothetical protein